MVDGILGTEDWIQVAHDSDGGWEWSAISVFYSPSARRYFWYDDAGCSCNWHMDNVTYVGDFYDGDKKAAIEAAHYWTNVQTEIRDFDPKKVVDTAE